MNSALPVMDASSATQSKVGAKKMSKNGNDLFAALFHSHTQANPKKAAQTPLSKNKTAGVPANGNPLKDEVALLSKDGVTAREKMASPNHAQTDLGKKEQTSFSSAHKGKTASSHKTTPSKSPHAQTSFNLSEGTIEQNTKKVEHSSYHERSGDLKTFPRAGTKHVSEETLTQNKQPSQSGRAFSLSGRSEGSTEQNIKKIEPSKHSVRPTDSETFARAETKHVSKETLTKNKQPLQSETGHKANSHIRKSTANEMTPRQKRNIPSVGQPENASEAAMMPSLPLGDTAGSKEAKESLPKQTMAKWEARNANLPGGSFSGSKKASVKGASHPSKSLTSREQGGFANVRTSHIDKKVAMVGKESVATSGIESLKKSMAHVNEKRVPGQEPTVQSVSQKSDFSAAVKTLGKSDKMIVQSQPVKAKKIAKTMGGTLAGKHVSAKKGAKKEKIDHDALEHRSEKSTAATEMAGRLEKQGVKRDHVHPFGQKGAEVMVVKGSDESASAPRNDVTMSREMGMPSSMQESASDTAGTSADSGGQEFSKQQEHTPHETRQTFKMEIKLNDLVINARMRQESLQLMINMDGMHRMNGRSLGDEIQTILSESGFKSYKLTLRDKSRKMYEHTEEETAAPNRFGGQERINVRA